MSNLIKSCKNPYNKAHCKCRHCDLYTDWVNTNFKEDPLCIAIFSQLYDFHLDTNLEVKTEHRDYCWGDNIDIDYTLSLFFPTEIAGYFWEWIETVLERHPFMNDKFHKVPIRQVNIFSKPDIDVD